MPDNALSHLPRATGWCAGRTPRRWRGHSCPRRPLAACRWPWAPWRRSHGPPPCGLRVRATATPALAVSHVERDACQRARGVHPRLDCALRWPVWGVNCTQLLEAFACEAFNRMPVGRSERKPPRMAARPGMLRTVQHLCRGPHAVAWLSAPQCTAPRVLPRAAPRSCVARVPSRVDRADDTTAVFEPRRRLIVTKGANSRAGADRVAKHHVCACPGLRSCTARRRCAVSSQRVLAS